MRLQSLVQAFANSIMVVDQSCSPYVSSSGRQYQPGIGPYAENETVKLVIEQLEAKGIAPCGQSLPYPAGSRQRCDLWIGDPVQWVIEVKMGRFRGDNGRPDDTAIKDLISPFRADRSALADGVKLASSGFPCEKAVLVYGFDDSERPLQDALDALEVLLRQQVTTSERREAGFHGLRHPVHRSGRVTAWEILGPNG